MADWWWASLALGVLVFRRPRRWPGERGATGRCSCCAAWAWFGIYNLALNEAERRIDAGTTAMLVNIGPILIAVFAGLLLGEGFPRWLLAGIAVAFVGRRADRRGDARARQADLVGVVFCVVAAITYAGGVVAQKPLLRRLPGCRSPPPPA